MVGALFVKPPGRLTLFDAVSRENASEWGRNTAAEQEALDHALERAKAEDPDQWGQEA